MENLWYIFTIICIIIIMAFTSINKIDAHAIKYPSKSLGEQVAFHQTQKDILLVNFTAQDNNHTSKRRRRQTLSFYSDFPVSSDNENAKEEQMVPIFKDNNCNSGEWYSSGSEYSLKPSKALNNLLRALKGETIKVPRDITLLDSERNIWEGNEGNEKKENILKDGYNAESKEMNESIERQTTIKGKSKEKNKFLDADKSKETSNFYNDFSNCDISSCQQCSQDVDSTNGVFKNTHKSPNESSSKNPKFFRKYFKRPAILVDQQLLDSFASKFSKDNQKYDYGHEEEDDLYHIKYPSDVLTSPQYQNKNQKNDDSTFANINNQKTNSSFNASQAVLNDQFENSKNNLSHEANYKLSKDEQDSSKNMKSLSCKWNLFKRSYAFNPMNEIKLKTSRRLMRKGFGASLPSYSLGETRRDLLIDNVLRRREKDMFQEENRKYKNFYKPFESNIMERNKQAKDFSFMKFEPLSRNWSLNRQKRTGGTHSRYKREQNEKEEIKAGNNLTSKIFTTDKFPVIQTSSETGGALNLKKTANINNFKAFANIDSIKAQHGETKTQRTLKLSGIFCDKTNHDEPTSFLDENNHDNGNEYAIQNFAKSLPFSKNDAKAFFAKSHYILNLKAPNRKKRSIQRHRFIKESRYNKAQKLPYVRTFNNHVQDYKILKPIKRFNPYKILELKLLRKINSSKTLNRNKPKKLCKNYETFRKRRSLQDMVTNSAENKHSILQVTKKLLPKLHCINRIIHNFIRKSIAYIPFGTTIRNNLQSAPIADSPTPNYKAFTKKEALPETINVTNHSVRPKSVLITDRRLIPEKAVGESFVAVIPQTVSKKRPVNKIKRIYDIKNPKLKFLKNIISSLFMFNNDIDENEVIEGKKFNQTRTKRDVHISKAFLGITKTEISDNFLVARNSFCGNLNINKEDDFSQRTSNENSDKKKYIWSEGNLNRILNKKRQRHKNFFEVEFYNATNLSTFNTSFHGKERKKKKAFGNSAFKNPIFEINNSRKLVAKFEKSSSSKTKFSIKNTKKFASGLKRSKRFLKTNLQEERFKKSSVLKNPRREEYFFYNDDLFTPSFDPNIFYKQPTYQQNDLSESTQIRYNKAIPSQSNNFENILNHLKMTNSQVENFYGNKFDNQRFQNNIRKECVKQKKRFSKTKDYHRKTKNVRNTFKTHNANFITPNKTKNLKPKNTPLNAPISDKSHNFNKNYKFKKNIFNWSKGYPKTNMNRNYNPVNGSHKLSLEMSNEILNCKAFANLEEFIKSLPKNLTQSLLTANTGTSLNSLANGKIQIDINSTIVGTEIITTTEPVMLGPAINCTTTIEEENLDDHTDTSMQPIKDNSSQSTDIDYEQPTESVKDENAFRPSTESIVEEMTTEYVLPVTEGQEDVKLNICINANVQGNAKNNHYSGNGSFNVVPSVMDDRQRRDILLSPIQKTPNRKFTETPIYEEDYGEDLSDLMSGKLSSKIVTDILNTVQESPHLKALWPSLKRDLPRQKKAQINFYPIRDQENAKELEHSEKLLSQVMSSINNIIEQQARTRKCVPLRSDLQEFYNLIALSRQQQDMVREKRRLQKTTITKDFSYETHLIDQSDIQQETKIVQKLLKKYDQLPGQDQVQVAIVHDDLVKNLIILLKLQDNEEQQEHDVRDKRENECDQSNIEIIRSLQSQYTPQFLKLLNAGQLYRGIHSD